VPIKNILAVIVFILWFVLGVLFAFVLSFSSIMNIDTNALLKKDPLLVVVFDGVDLIVTGLFVLIFSNEIGMWSSKLRKRISTKFPLWKRMSGLPEEKVQYYLSFEYNSRMVLISALILIAIGVLLSVIVLAMRRDITLFN
jgi:hypothetical protein